MIFVPDTNIYVSSVIYPKGHAGQIMRVWQQDLVELALSEPILAEIERVLQYPRIRKRHHWKQRQVKQYIQTLRQSAILTPGTSSVNAVPNDPTDDKFFACAVEAQANYIVSGDEEHVLPVGNFQGVEVVKPRDFLEILSQIKHAA